MNATLAATEARFHARCTRLHAEPLSSALVGFTAAMKFAASFG